MDRRLLARWAGEPRPRRFFVVEAAELGALLSSSLVDGCGGLASTRNSPPTVCQGHGGALRRIWRWSMLGRPAIPGRRQAELACTE
jgi:hypothetical protein